MKLQEIWLELQNILQSSCPVQQTRQQEAWSILQKAYLNETNEELKLEKLWMHPEWELTHAVLHRAIEYAQQRAQGQLLQHVLGVQTFWEHEYVVGPDVLVPRPETEILLMTAFQELAHQPMNYGFELGLGSGVLSIELLAWNASLKMVATERMPMAIERARFNAKRILGQTDRLKIIPAKQGEVWEPLEHSWQPFKFDFLISNPPYLQKDLKECQLDVWMQEPAEALFAPSEDLLFFYRQFAQRARDFIHVGGCLLMEVPHQRVDQIASLFLNLGHCQILKVKDLTQRDRVIVVRLL